MENNNKNKQNELMNINNIIPASENNNFIPMEEEDESTNSNINELKENDSKNKVVKISSELNCSASTINSNANKSTNTSLNSLDKSVNNKKEESDIIFKIEKINSNKKLNNINNNEYFDEIYTNLRLDEKNSNLKIEKHYMKQQNDINQQMRAILIDWLIEVNNRFHFKEKTLFQAVYIIDLYLSYKIIHRIKFQLLGVASLLIAVKENEIFYPRIDEFISITDNAYKKEELLNMELQVLKTLNFEILVPTAEEFYNILSKIFNFNNIQHHLGEYFLDSSLVDYNMLKYKSSTIGISCAYIVMKFYCLNGYKDLYLSKLISGDSTQKLIKDCAKDLCHLVKNLSKSYLRATKDKYSCAEYDCVATLCEEN